MGPMQCQTVKAIMISIAAQEVRCPLRTFVLLSLVWILQFCSLSLCSALRVFLFSFPGRNCREKRKTEDGGRGEGRQERYRRRSQQPKSERATGTGRGCRLMLPWGSG